MVPGDIYRAGKNSNARSSGQGTVSQDRRPRLHTEQFVNRPSFSSEASVYTGCPAAFVLTPAVVRGAPGVGVRVHKRAQRSRWFIQVLKNIFFRFGASHGGTNLYFKPAFVPWFEDTLPIIGFGIFRTGSTF